jgi:hypothetical protein
MALRAWEDDTSSMTCCQCAMTIWECACCDTSCQAPVCERCKSAGEGAHDRSTVVLPQLSADASYATW